MRPHYNQLTKFKKKKKTPSRKRVKKYVPKPSTYKITNSTSAYRRDRAAITFYIIYARSLYRRRVVVPIRARIITVIGTVRPYDTVRAGTRTIISRVVGFKKQFSKKPVSLTLLVGNRFPFFSPPVPQRNIV